MTTARRWFFLLVFALLPVTALAQVTARASLDRTQARMGETVALTITVDGLQQAAPPDLSPLSGDFAVLGSSTNSSLSIINGQRTLRTEFGVALRPNRPGTITIPPLDVAGQRTAPLTLQVDAASAAAPSSRQGPVFLEASADTDSAVVGQAISYSVRLFYALDLADGSLGDPQAAGLSMRRVGNDSNYQAQRNGTTYRVLERHYVVFAQHAGKLTIPSVNFQGEALDQRGQDPFFAGTSPVSAMSNTVDIHVDPVPDAGAKGTWLPATALTLKLDGLPTDGKAQVGTPLTLNLTLEATGLPFEVLPALSLPALDGADVYPDKASTGTRDDGSKLIGRRSQAFAVVPNRAGTLSIPEITLHWWNTRTRTMEVARVAAARIQVLGKTGAAAPAAGSSAAIPAGGSGTNAPGGQASAGPPSAGDGAAGAVSRWKAITAALVVVWIATLVFAVWLWRRRRRAPRAARRATTPTLAGRKGFLAAVNAGDTARIEQALLRWARETRPSLRNLGELAGALSSQAQREAISSLQRARFASSAATLDTQALSKAFEPGLAWSRDVASSHDDLPPLYPDGG
jgi:oxygen tolerance protein BatD